MDDDMVDIDVLIEQTSNLYCSKVALDLIVNESSSNSNSQVHAARKIICFKPHLKGLLKVYSYSGVELIKDVEGSGIKA